MDEKLKNKAEVDQSAKTDVLRITPVKVEADVPKGVTASVEVFADDEPTDEEVEKVFAKPSAVLPSEVTDADDAAYADELVAAYEKAKADNEKACADVSRELDPVKRAKLEEVAGIKRLVLKKAKLAVNEMRTVASVAVHEARKRALEAKEAASNK